MVSGLLAMCCLQFVKKRKKYNKALKCRSALYVTIKYILEVNRRVYAHKQAAAAAEEDEIHTSANLSLKKT